MAHSINGIITGFKYEGNLPNIVLVDHYHFIPFKSNSRTTPSDEPFAPYGELTPKVRQTIKDLSIHGKCAYVETEYFGGIGVQIAETWENGLRIEGPLISYDGVNNKTEYEDVTIVDYPINQALKHIGVAAQEGKDEFDTLGLGRYRSNRKIFAEWDQKQ